MTRTPEGQTPRPDRGRPAAGGSASGGDIAGFAFQFAISVIICAFAGQWLDKKFGTAPWLLMIGMFLGTGLSFFSMYGKLAALQARDDEARAAKRSKPS